MKNRFSIHDKGMAIGNLNPVGHTRDSGAVAQDPAIMIAGQPSVKKGPADVSGDDTGWGRYGSQAGRDPLRSCAQLTASRPYVAAKPFVIAKTIGQFRTLIGRRKHNDTSGCKECLACEQLPP